MKDNVQNTKFICIICKELLAISYQMVWLLIGYQVDFNVGLSMLFNINVKLNLGEKKKRKKVAT